MPRLFIHIGAHKTGTTALQVAFDRNRNMLAKHGVIYPKTNWYHHSQHRLAFALRGQRDPQKGDVPNLAEEFDALNAVIQGADENARIFISSEEFFSIPADAIREFREGIKCDAVMVLAVVRRPDDLLLSIYNQQMKTPTNEFKRPFQNVLQDPWRLHPDMDQPRCVMAWAEVFGYDRICLCQYETVDTVSMFLELLGVQADKFVRPQRINQSVPAAVLEIMRVAKVAGMDPSLRCAVFEYSLHVFSGHLGLDMSGADRQRILERYEADFESLFARFDQQNPYRANLVDSAHEPKALPAPAILYAKLLERILVERQS